jgi:cyclopropane fatty-acyl-phospholipid synthase-like methyltransferase
MDFSNKMGNIVEQFYRRLPFNKAEHADYLNQINKPKTPWPKLNDIINDTDTVLELGSGQGWLSNRIATQYPHIKVTGIDLVQKNISRSLEYAPDNAKFYTEDILITQRRATTTISVGVLHHIPNYYIQDLMVRAINTAEKYAFIGLYHTQSRKHVLDYFAGMSSDKKRYRMFKKMTPWISNEEHRKSWYRDQLQHPYECTATVQDYQDVANRTGTQLVWVSTESDKQLESDALKKINTYEFTSGFIYGLFKKGI